MDQTRSSDRLTVDITGLREDLQTFADEEERSLSKMANILLREAIENRKKTKLNPQQREDR